MTNNQTAKWRFASNGGIEDVGINDAGIETFSINHIDSLVRESIQNSMDAEIDKNKTVEVGFNMFTISSQDIPDYKGLKTAITSCKSSQKNDEDVQTFCDSALKTLNNKNIDILKISDYNTTGLTGSENPDDPDTPWYGLIKKTGSSNNKNGTSGGSFGIGKNAYFAASDLRTVFFSSYNNNGHKSHIGITRLCSFGQGKDKKTGKGLYSQDERFSPIEKLLDLNNNKRTTIGTDIYILGVSSVLNKNKFEERIIERVLYNFFISILQNKLVIHISSSKGKNHKISKATLEKYMRKLDTEKKEFNQLTKYYQLLTSSEQQGIYKIPLKSEEYGKEYGFNDGECTLYLLKDEEDKSLNRKVLMTRKRGMRLFEKGNINGTIQFTGIMIISGENMNKVFRKMEVPAHDKWAPDRCRNQKTKYNTLLNEFYKYIKKKVNEKIAPETPETIDAFGLADLIPDITQKEDEDAHPNEISTRIKSLNLKEVNQKKEKRKLKKQNNKKIRADRATDSDVEGDTTLSSEHEGTRKLDSRQNSLIANPNGKYKGFKLEDQVQDERFGAVNLQTGKFKYLFKVPKKAKFARLTFILIGEQKPEEIKVYDVKVEGKDAQFDKLDKNSVILSNLVKGDYIKIEFTTDINFNCRIDVHYETKR